MRMEMVWVESRWQLVNAEVDVDQRWSNCSLLTQKLVLDKLLCCEFATVI